MNATAAKGRKQGPAITGLSIILGLGLKKWHKGLPRKMREIFGPSQIVELFPFTIAMAFFGEHFTTTNELTDTDRAGVLEGWAAEYAKAPKYIPGLLGEAFGILWHPKTKTKAIELHLLSAPADEKDDATAAAVEVRHQYLRREGRAVTGEDVKKVRQNLALRTKKFQSVRSWEGTFKELVLGSITVRSIARAEKKASARSARGKISAGNSP